MICLGHCFFCLQFPNFSVYGLWFILPLWEQMRCELGISICCIGMCWDLCFVQTFKLFYVWGYVFIIFH
jgi:hypothetical protein